MNTNENVDSSFGTIIDTVRNALRIKSHTFDEEIQDLIEACLKDLSLVGISSSKLNKLDDPLIKSAIYNYSKANFGLDNSDSEKYRLSYENLRLKMSISDEYTKEGKDHVDG